MFETTTHPLHLLFLDWEKAFDKVNQDGLMEAMERMNVDPKLIRLTKQLYKNPTFQVELDGKTSDWFKQETGIRQGCPLSPYLFVLVMSVVFHGIKENLKTHKRTLTPLIGIEFTEIL